MGCREFKHDTAELLRQGEEIMASRDPDHRFMERVTVVVMVLHGYCTVVQAASTFSRTTACINNWLRIVDNEGFERLRAKKSGGRKPKLTAGQKKELRAVLQAPPPEKYRVWDGVTLSAYIKERFGVDFSVRSG